MGFAHVATTLGPRSSTYTQKEKARITASFPRHNLQDFHLPEAGYSGLKQVVA